MYLTGGTSIVYPTGNWTLQSNRRSDPGAMLTLNVARGAKHQYGQYTSRYVTRTMRYVVGALVTAPCSMGRDTVVKCWVCIVSACWGRQINRNTKQQAIRPRRRSRMRTSENNRRRRVPWRMLRGILVPWHAFEKNNRCYSNATSPQLPSHFTESYSIQRTFTYNNLPCLKSSFYRKRQQGDCGCYVLRGMI